MTTLNYLKKCVVVLYAVLFGFTTMCGILFGLYSSLNIKVDAIQTTPWEIVMYITSICGFVGFMWPIFAFIHIVASLFSLSSVVVPIE